MEASPVAEDLTPFDPLDLDLPHACHLSVPPAAPARFWMLAPAAVVAVVWLPFVAVLPL